MPPTCASTSSSTSCARCQSLASDLERTLNAFKTLKTINPNMDSEILIKSLENLLVVNAAAPHPPASPTPTTNVMECSHKKKPKAVAVYAAATQTEGEFPVVIKKEFVLGKGHGDCLVDPEVWQQVKASVIKVKPKRFTGPGGIMYKCPQCLRKYSACQAAMKHILVVHQNYDVHCPTCKKKFFFETTFENHLAICTGPGPLRKRSGKPGPASSSGSGSSSKRGKKKNQEKAATWQRKKLKEEQF